MYRRSIALPVTMILLCAPFRAVLALPSGELSLQTPRQAVVEMFSGNLDKFRQHLTVPMQQKVNDLLQNAAPGSSNPLVGLAPATSGEKFDSFDSGPILFSWNSAQQHQRYELHVDADDQRGDEDVMQLSLHSFRSGIEEDVPVHLQLQLDLMLQDSVWRLNDVTLSIKLPVGDPRILDKSWWTPQMLASSSALDRTPAETPERPSLSPMRAVRRIALAENLYAQHHPATGYTCSLPNLVNVGKGLDEFGPYTLLDPELAGGVYNGYSFAVKGCEGKPAKGFQVIAEPLSGTGKAYCSDDRHNLRSSDDGRGVTCLAAGRIARE